PAHVRPPSAPPGGRRTSGHLGSGAAGARGDRKWAGRRGVPGGTQPQAGGSTGGRGCVGGGGATANGERGLAHGERGGGRAGQDHGPGRLEQRVVDHGYSSRVGVMPVHTSSRAIVTYQ